jgi:hypothetical protein
MRWQYSCGRCLQFDLAVSTQYLCGDGIIVSGADGLSRREDVYDYQMVAHVLESRIHMVMVVPQWPTQS